eukprot:s1385_g42.t1
MPLYPPSSRLAWAFLTPLAFLTYVFFFHYFSLTFTSLRKDVYVVTESAFGLRGHAKPMHFSRQRERFKDFLPQIEHVILDNCSKYSREVEKMRQENSKRKRRGGTMFSAEGIQRICVLKTLIERRPEIPDDALVIFSDLDEVPSAKAIQMLRVCKSLPAAKEGPWIQEHYPLPYNLRVGCKAKRGSQLHMQGVFVTMGFLRRKKTLALRYNVRQNRIVPKAGIHLTYAGSRADVDYKLLHHGESGQILAMKATAKGQRLNFCKVDQKTVLDMEQLLRDNPVSVARAWESKSSILHKETQSPSELAKCYQRDSKRVAPGRSSPDFCISLARRKLRSARHSPEERARAAFVAGFWYRVSLIIEYAWASDYEPVLPPSTWLVSKGSGISDFARTNSRREAERFCEDQEGGKIVERFPSVTELQIFCAGAQIPVPPLVQWTRRN